MNKLHDQQKKIEAEIHKLEEMGGSFTGKARQYRDSAFGKFPVLFALMTTFGLVSTFYGFEKVIDGITFFEQNPQMVLVAGLVTLSITGTLHQKLK
jgi:hypothetical protein